MTERISQLLDAGIKWYVANEVARLKSLRERPDDPTIPRTLGELMEFCERTGTVISFNVMGE